MLFCAKNWDVLDQLHDTRHTAADAVLTCPGATFHNVQGRPAFAFIHLRLLSLHHELIQDCA